MAYQEGQVLRRRPPEEELAKAKLPPEARELPRAVRTEQIEASEARRRGAIVTAVAGPLCDLANKLQREGKLPNDSLFVQTFKPA